MRRTVPAALAVALGLAACAPEGAGPSATGEEGALSVERRAFSDNVLMRFESAEALYREAALRAGGDEDVQGEMLLHLAMNRSNLGEYQAAEEIFAGVRPRVARRGSVVTRMKSSIFYAQHLLNQGKAEAAEAEVAAAILLGREMLSGTRAAEEGAAPEGPALASFRIGDEASALLESSARPGLGLDTDTRRLTERERVEVLTAHAELVTAAARRAQGTDDIMGPLDRANGHLAEVPPESALWLRGEVGLTRADAVARAGDLRGAERETADAIRDIRRFAASERPEAVARLRHGKLLLDLDREGEARAAYRRGLEVLSRGGRGVSYDALAPYLALLVEDVAAGAPGAADEAFLALQQLRDPVTSDTLSRLAARLAAGETEAGRAIREAQDAERDVNRLNALLDTLAAADPRDPNALSVTRERLAAARVRLGTARARLAEAAPNYGQILNESITLGELQGLLRPGEAFVTVRLGTEGGIVAAVTPVGFELAPVAAGEAEIAGLVERIRESVVSPVFDVEAARALYRLVMEPVGASLATASSVIYAPDGPLLSIPGGLMVTADVPAGFDPSAFDYTGISWLGTGRALSVTMSPSSFALLRRAPRSAASRPFLGFGDFVPYGAGQAGAVAARREAPAACVDVLAAVGELPRLSGTAEELAALGRIVAGSAEASVSGPAFTDEAVLGADLRDVRILHFATQGLLPLSAECLPEPALATSLGGAGSDGLLEAGEVVELALDADLVVLSACDTGGRGATSGLGTGFRRTGGEALSGLVRAFFYAGARNVVASHWIVPDTETVALMVGLYEGVAAGEEPAEAMRAARARLASEPFTSHPFFWASFSVVGDGAQEAVREVRPVEAGTTR